MGASLSEWLSNAGFDGFWAKYTSEAIMIGILILVCILADIIARKVLLRGLVSMAKKTKSTWDDKLVARGVFNRLAHIAPGIVAYFGIPAVVGDLFDPIAVDVAVKAVLVYMIGVSTLVVLAAIDAGQDIYEQYPVSKNRPIKGYLQIVKLLGLLVGGILIITTVMDINPVGILSGLGAMSAVLLLVFKDSIMGLVASVQLSVNNMVRIGDWIEMPKYGADGDVIDITLQSIKVQNWDKTITTIPIYSLISDSFKNWRGMSEGGGRRIKRALYIDMNSVRFLTDQEIDHHKSNPMLEDYITAKQKDLSEYVKDGQKKPLRKLTNIGTLREYMKSYLAANPVISQDLTFLVRQLPPGPEGIGLEIYVFSKDKVWANYEAIQADIFDHMLAILPDFDLRVFQQPTGSDLQLFAKR